MLLSTQLAKTEYTEAVNGGDSGPEYFGGVDEIFIDKRGVARLIANLAPFLVGIGGMIAQRLTAFHRAQLNSRCEVECEFYC